MRPGGRAAPAAALTERPRLLRSARLAGNMNGNLTSAIGPAVESHLCGRAESRLPGFDLHKAGGPGLDKSDWRLMMML